MWLSRYFIIFVLYSVLGWVYESTFCTIKAGEWKNRGFLYGPVVPIYGVGAAGISMVYDAMQLYMHITLSWWQVFLIGYLGSIVLEFGTSWILEKLFHAVWWDYSDMPFNIQGRVCLPCSLGFGFAGLLVIYGLYPVMNRVVTPDVSIWKELGSLLLMALIAADTALTVSALTGLAKSVVEAEESLNRQMEVLVSTVKEKSAELEEAVSASKDKLMNQHVENAVRQMGGLQKSALRRVKGFKPPVGRTDRQKEYLRMVMGSNRALRDKTKK